MHSFDNTTFLSLFIHHRPSGIVRITLSLSVQLKYFEVFLKDSLMGCYIQITFKLVKMDAAVQTERWVLLCWFMMTDFFLQQSLSLGLRRSYF
jgi:hypothetical protein